MASGHALIRLRVFVVLLGYADKRVHPGQYALAGIAHIIFYLLFLVIGVGRLRFQFPDGWCGDGAVLLYVNTAWLCASRKLGLRALGVSKPLSMCCCEMACHGCLYWGIAAPLPLHS